MMDIGQSVATDNRGLTRIIQGGPNLFVTVAETRSLSTDPGLTRPRQERNKKNLTGKMTKVGIVERVAQLFFVSRPIPTTT